VFSGSNNNTCSPVLNVLQFRNQMLGCTIQQRVAIVYFTEAPNDGFPLNTFKTLFRLSRVLLNIWKCAFKAALQNLYLFGHPRATLVFSKLQGLQYYFPETFRCSLKIYERENFSDSSLHIFVFVYFKYPFYNEKYPDLESEM